MKSLIFILIFISCLWSETSPQDKKVTFITDPVDPFVIGKLNEVPTSGIVVDIIQRVFDDIEGYAPEHAPITIWKRSLMLVEQGQIDAISVILKNKKREELYHYSNKVISGKTVFFYKKGAQSVINWKTPKDLEAFSICAVKGYNVEKYLNTLQQKHQLNLNIYTVNEFGKCFQLQLKNRIDLYAENYYTGLAHLKKQGLDTQFEVMQKPVYAKDFYFAFSKKSEAYQLIPQINQSLKKLQDKGVVEELEKKYLGL